MKTNSSQSKENSKELFPKLFIGQLLPPFLRKEKRMAFLQAALAPFQALLKSTLEATKEVEYNIASPPTASKIKMQIEEKYERKIFIDKNSNNSEENYKWKLAGENDKELKNLKKEVLGEIDKRMIAGAKRSSIALYDKSGKNKLYPED